MNYNLYELFATSVPLSGLAGEQQITMSMSCSHTLFPLSSLAGVDLNRQWKRPSRALHPTIYWLKHLIRQEQGQKGVAMYIDLHGHRQAAAAVGSTNLVSFLHEHELN